MALFALTGILSLGAGMGVGALLPVSGKPKPITRATPMPMVNVPQPSLPPSSVTIKPTKKLQGGGAQAPLKQAPLKQEHQTLDFDEFDKSLMKMLQGQPGKISTIRPSVAYDSQYYSPPSSKPFVKSPAPQPQLPAPQPQPTPTQRPPLKQPLQGGGSHKPPNLDNNLKTSWF